MARPKKLKPEIKQNALLEAFKFLSLVTKDVGSPSETHVHLNNGYASAYNGIVSAGCRIENDISACPNNKLIVEALSKCGDNISITQLDDFRLSIKSEKFKAIVPCINSASIQISIADVLVGEINDEFKVAIETVGVLASENAQSVVAASILMNGASLIATDRHVLFEYWHGINLPLGISLPKAIVKPLVSCNKKLVGYGFSSSSFTFHFEDNSWIKTQLYAETWPDLSTILNGTSNPFPVPADLWEGLSAIAPFAADGLTHLTTEMLLAGPKDNPTASYQVAGIPNGPTYTIRQLLLLKSLAKEIDFLAPGSHQGTYMLRFFGDKIRGCITGRG